jgi:hypothetical protein
MEGLEEQVVQVQLQVEAEEVALELEAMEIMQWESQAD